MRGEIHSINVSDGGVPKSMVDSANILKGGVQGDFNRFRASRGGSVDRAVCIFSLELIQQLKHEGHPIEIDLRARI